ncbi:MAG: hypothetical protein Q8R92_07195, partial [Deltaproteobacteria bacterium]|nr:hypothetical protein [Deltaproteobacteria bacterium]
MLIAIHETAGSFSDRWIAYCRREAVPHKIVNCLDSGIISDLRGADTLLWHWRHQNAREQMLARHVIKSAEIMGLAVFPNLKTCWHFDDKVAQKYMLEAVGAPLVPTWVFSDPESALRWVEGSTFPKVFKLRRGAGSANVRLVENNRQAARLVRTAFGRGFLPTPGYFHDARRRFRSARKREIFRKALRRLPGTLGNIRRANRRLGRESGYVLFQEFVPDNAFDTRVTIIGQRAFAFTRNVRPGDFRASGSGDIVYDRDRIRPECLRVARDVTRRVGAQSMAFDFVFSEERGP